MTDCLEISIGQYSDKGCKEINQDFHGAVFPQGPLLATKGIAVAIADGISTSSVSQIAAETSIKSFLTDYYCTSETWSVKTSAQRVISASNSWAYAQTKRSQHAYDLDKGYVCTFSAIVFKARHAHIVHVGDSRIYRLAGSNIEQLTNDHRKEMLHQNLRPKNFMIDKEGTVKIIDFGATKISGVLELSANFADEGIAGTLQYTAPELFIGAPSSRASDFFSLGVITYQMLSGKLPYGTQVARISNQKSLRKLKYSNASRIDLNISDWIDGALHKATHPEPNERYETLTEFLTDLRTPNKKFLITNHTPLAERNPIAFWQGVSLVLFAIIIIMMFW